MADTILVLNAGSSSVKFSLFHAERGAVALAQGGQVSGIGGTTHLAIKGAADQPVPGTDHHAALAAIEAWLQRQSSGPLLAVGHRVVHGGLRFDGPVLVDDDVLSALDALVPLAPLHQPHALEAIREAQRLFPGVPQVACFDTSFHHGSPAVAQTYGLPRAMTQAGLRRYGFHGLSYEYIASRLPAVAPGLAQGRVVVAHLGNGASMCALRAGRSQASTMGLSALDGLVMGTRCGTLDPAVVLYLQQQDGMTASAVEHLLYEQSGLLGVSGLSSDMQALLASDDPAAREAVDLFVYRIGRELGSLAAALGGLDGLVFTGGIGENAAEIRGRVCRDAAWLGLTLDEPANQAGRSMISAPGAPVGAWMIPTDENLVIARHSLGLVRQTAPG